MRVFVYGTLKRSHNNHGLLKDAEFVGVAYTLDPYRMYTVGFPVIRPAADGKSVFGEVYDVDENTLKRLDNLENEGVMYDRTVIPIVFPSTQRNMEQIDEASAYIGTPNYWDQHTPAVFDTVNQAGELEWR